MKNKMKTPNNMNLFTSFQSLKNKSNYNQLKGHLKKQLCAQSIKRKLTVEMFWISLHRPQGLLINQGIASRKVWDGGCVELPIWNEKDKRPWIQGFVILTEEKIVNPLRNDEKSSTALPNKGLLKLCRWNLMGIWFVWSTFLFWTG